jgi:hypothetical protein
MEFLKKGQFNFIDFIIGLVIFVILITFFFRYSSNITKREEGITGLAVEARTVSNELLSEGFPCDWNSSSVVAIGITDGNNQINESKLQSLINIDYEETRILFRTKYDYVFFFEDNEGNIIPIGDICAVGYIQPGINIADDCGDEDVIYIGQTIDGNIEEEDKSVCIKNSQINSNIYLEGGSLIVISSNVTGSITTDETDVTVSNSNINGNLYTSADGNSSMFIVAGNHIDGSSVHTKGRLYSVNNTINGNLEANCPTVVLEAKDNEVNGQEYLCSEGTGIDCDKTYFEIDAEKLVKLERIVFFRSQIAKLVLYLWQ